MASNITVEDLIEEQKRLEFDSEELLQSKLDSVEQDVTIKSIGLHRYPTFGFKKRGYDSSVAEDHRVFASDDREVPVSAFRISLLAFVLDSDTDYNRSDYDKWAKTGSISTDAKSKYEYWVRNTDALYNSLYQADNSQAVLQDLGTTTDYRSGAVYPTLTITVLFEDAAGIQSIGMTTLPGAEQSVKEFVTSVIDENNCSEDETETNGGDTNAGGVRKYDILETDAQLIDKELVGDEFSVEFDIINPIDWFSAPFVSCALQSLDEIDVGLLSCYNDDSGWYEASVPVDFSSVPEKRIVGVDTPFDRVHLRWNSSLAEDSGGREFFETIRFDDDDTPRIPIRLLLTAAEPEISKETPYKVSAHNMWVVKPHPEYFTESSESESESESDSMDETEAVDSSQGASTDRDGFDEDDSSDNDEETERKTPNKDAGNDSSSSLLSRLTRNNE